MTELEFNELMATPRYYYTTPAGIVAWVREKGILEALKEVAKMRKLARDFSGEKYPEYVLRDEDTFYLIGREDVFQIKGQIPFIKSLPEISLVEDFKERSGLENYQVTRLVF